MPLNMSAADRLRRSRPVLAVSLALSACTAGPDYHAPAPIVPASFGSGDAGAPQQDMSGWWRRLGDPLLDGLVARAMAANLDVRQAASRIAGARAQERIAGAGSRPQLGASAQGSYIRLSKNSNIAEIAGAGTGTPDFGSAGLPGSDFATYQAGFDASWEIDLFGGTRRAVEAARARSQAAEWSLRDAQVLLAAEVGSAYLRYRAFDRRIAIADAQLRDGRMLLDFVNTRVRNGLATSLDARRQEREIARVAADREGLVAEREAELHALGVLLGQAPLAFADELRRRAPAPVAPLSVPPGLPSELLLRRPDIRAAERHLAAATADIGVAAAALFPKITLSGAVNLVSTSLAHLLSIDSLQPNGAGRIGLPLLDGGRRRGAVALREAQAGEAWLGYQKTVLAALRDVEDALSRLEADRRREVQLAASDAAARDALETARVQYRHGLVPFIDMLDAQNALGSAEDMLAQARAATAQDIVSLYKALGGGWNERMSPAGEGED
ncbi:Fis family transcriptional regulator [Sphingomonas oleivorans]|uniref:Fis family transcriptional regulator n=1 Tax=Sphingomonas oleivorans TaxID=1735121 RepID=A0A2T5G200_9SPHN|nr:efflux transporter outer membrane subunit [Sphingomonas oleivorans]PTQ13175.1 Fis family transcriptional regulator [Sphingomonas oleivorans]